MWTQLCKHVRLNVYYSHKFTAYSVISTWVGIQLAAEDRQAHQDRQTYIHTYRQTDRQTDRGGSSHRESLFVLAFIGDVDEEGYNGGVPLHQLHHKVEAQMHTLTDKALMPGCAAADQAVQRLHHHLTLGLVTLHQTSNPKPCNLTPLSHFGPCNPAPNLEP